jgi:acyl-CoA reductase-like NAD-dependent aldehyde dehydrogenase
MSRRLGTTETYLLDSDDTLLAQGRWSGKVYSNGWRVTSNAVSDVIEPATERVLGQVGVAMPADIARAAAAARLVQPVWAAEDYRSRAAIFRKAARLTRRPISKCACVSIASGRLPRCQRRCKDWYSPALQGG